MGRILSVTACSMLFTLITSAGIAQDVPRYTPQRPTISPYLNLLRNDNGTLPNYYSLVRPQLNQQRFDNRILSETQSQAKAVRSLSSVSGENLVGPTGTASTFGNRSHFLNRSHFYRSRPAGGRGSLR